MLLSNQTVRFFDHQDLRKESINVFRSFCMEVVTKVRKHLELSLLVWCDQTFPVMPKLEVELAVLPLFDLGQMFGLKIVLIEELLISKETEEFSPQFNILDFKF